MRIVRPAARSVHVARVALVLLVAALVSGSARAQWDPSLGQWGRSDPDDLRVMTWNVGDVLCSTQPKQAGAASWDALVRIVAALQPDVLLVQEAGDNDGNGTGSGVDNVASLLATAQLLLRGGFDPFQAEPVTSWVQRYAPRYDLPYAFASAATDGFNRNLLLSRHPFADLNGDGKSTQSDMPALAPFLYATTGGTGGIRGWQIAEIDLPDARYAGDLVVGNSHLKSGSTTAEHAQRVAAAQNMAVYIEHLLNGAGHGVPDPFGKLADLPPAATILPAGTFVVMGGDLNEDEAKNGALKGPADWIAAAQFAEYTAVADGTDRDGSDMRYDAAADPFTGESDTHFVGKLDYLVWQDSVGTLRRAFVFDSASLPPGGEATPPSLAGFEPDPRLASALASDHLPVVADFRLPAPPCNDARVSGSGTPGSGGKVPRAAVCGLPSSAAAASFTLHEARPFAPAFPIVAAAPGPAPFAGGVLVPSPPLVLGPILTGPDGALVVAGVAGGGLACTLHLQWVVLDPVAVSGMALSNALAVRWRR